MITFTATTATRQQITAAIQRSIRDVLDDVAGGRVPALEVGTVVELQQHVDPTSYAGLDDGTWTERDVELVLDGLDRWIRRGGLTLAALTDPRNRS